MTFHGEGFPLHGWGPGFIPRASGNALTCSFPILLQPGAALSWPRKQLECLSSATCPEQALLCVNPVLAHVACPSCASYTDIFILSSRAFGNGKQRFRLSCIQAWEHGRMTSINIQKIMASFNFQQKAYLSLKRLHQVFPCRAEQWSRCKTMTGNFLYMKRDCQFLV